MSAIARYHLVELHRPQGGWGELQAAAAQARSAAEQVSSEGTPVRFLRSIFVPDDETCFHLFEGTAEAVAEASGRTVTGYGPIVEVVDLPGRKGAGPEAASGRDAEGATEFTGIGVERQSECGERERAETLETAGTAGLETREER
jgi:hypothetical protein